MMQSDADDPNRIFAEHESNYAASEAAEYPMSSGIALK